MSDTLNEAKALFDQNELVGSLDVLNRIILNDHGNCDAFLLRARIQYKMQQWGKSMNDYGSVLEIDPDNREAKYGREMVGNILGYFTPDLFNP
jgi:tetratricopeptide (TPR) repeat protein